MRIAVLIIGLLLSVGLFVQSLAGNALTSLAEDEGGQEATAERKVQGLELDNDL